MWSCRWIPKIQWSTISIIGVKVSVMGTQPGNASTEIWMWSLRNRWAHNKFQTLHNIETIHWSSQPSVRNRTTSTFHSSIWATEINNFWTKFSIFSHHKSCSCARHQQIKSAWTSNLLMFLSFVYWRILWGKTRLTQRLLTDRTTSGAEIGFPWPSYRTVYFR